MENFEILNKGHTRHQLEIQTIMKKYLSPFNPTPAGLWIPWEERGALYARLFAMTLGQGQ